MYQKQDFKFSEYGWIFAFSKQQFDEAKQEWVEYVNCWLWLLAPKDKAKEMIKEFDKHTKQEIQKALEIDWIDKIIKYEYNNHECDRSGDIEPLQFLVDDYWTTREHIKKVLNITR